MTSLIQYPTSNVVACIAVVYAILFCSSIAVFFLARGTEKYTELVSRIKTFWVIVTLLSLSLCIRSNYAIFFWVIISYLALKEFFTIIPTRQIDRRVLFWAYISIPVQYYWIATNWYGMFTIFIPVYFFLFVPFRMVILEETKGFLHSMATIQWGVMLMVYCMGYIAALYLLPADKNPAGGAPGLIFYLLFLNQMNDVAQYIVGKTMGKNKIIPAVSPNKTIEGFVGGIIATIILAVIFAPYLTPLNLRDSILIGLIIACVGFIGDVTMSALKRDLGIKDTGKMLPGHGGILDRIDSLLFTAPIYFHYIGYFYYS